MVAYKKIWNLELISAEKYIQAEKIGNPENSIPHLLDNYVQFFKVFTQEDVGTYEEFKKACSRNLEALAKESRSRSPYYLYSLAEIHLQSSLMRAKFQDYWSASFELKRAYSDLEKNSVLFPGFVLDNTSLGIIETLIGNLPSSVKFILSPLGLKGDLNQGLQKMENNFSKLKNSTLSFYYPEPALFYVYLCSNLAPSRKSFNELKLIIDPISDKSLIKIFIASQMALKKYHNEDAIDILKSKPQGLEYPSFSQLDYLMGTAYLNRLDTNCLSSFNYFLKNTKSENLKTDARLRVSWAYSLMGKEELAKKNLAYCLHSDHVGHNDRDKQALIEAERGLPNGVLLRAKLLFDGGYFMNSFEVLNAMDSSSLKEFRERLEFTYRKARDYEAVEKFPTAIYFYKKTLELGKNEPYYFAANSSLHLGFIYERLKKFILAKHYYEKCLELNEKEYKSSIDLEAQNGLSRVQ